MSSSDTRRVVHTVRLQAAVDQELGRSRVDQVRRLIEEEVSCLPALASGLQAANSLHELQSTLFEMPEASLRLTVEVLDAGRQVLEGQAAAANLDPEIVAPLVSRLDELRTISDEMPPGQVRMLAQAAFAAAAEAEAKVTDAVTHTRAHRLAGEAVAEILRRMGLEPVVEIDGDELTITGTNLDGQVADISVDHDLRLDVSFEDPADAVDVCHPDAGEYCQPAVDFALEFHTVLPELIREDGLDVGRVETSAPPTRGPGEDGARRRRPVHRSATRRAAS